MTTSITIVGLGPGRWSDLNLQAHTVLAQEAAEQPFIYAVPGHPLIGEASVQRVLSLARERGLSTSVVAGLSFLEPVCTALELDPLESGTQLIDATTLASFDTSEIAGKIL